ncbi:MAG: glucosaminidase domain-containing protein [Bacteroidota bacterium]
MRRSIQIIAILLVAQVQLFATDISDRYINKHKDLAISEMKRTGVPASIKLAQGILESDFGRSRLAQRANNHFGIKCGGDWVGATFYKEDDDYDKRGKLVKSCFRKYGKVRDSWVAHSEFLKRPRYRHLFYLRPSDYKGWARGLRQAGYATSPTYAQKLITVIERYQLFQYDDLELELPEEIVPETRPNRPQLDRRPTDRLNDNTRLEDLGVVSTINDVKVTHSLAGETLMTVADRTNTSVNALMKYNEMLTSSSTVLPTGTRVFLQPKRSTNRSKETWHKVQSGETMYDISQQYGLRMDRLYERNRMKEGTQPAIGEQIMLRGRRRDSPNLRDEAASEDRASTQEDDGLSTPVPDFRPTPKVEETVTIAEEDFFEEGENNTVNLEELDAPVVHLPTTATDRDEMIYEDLDVAAELSVDNNPTQVSNRRKERVVRSTPEVAAPQFEDRLEEEVVTAPISESTSYSYYVVRQKDTLYSIARMYGATVDQIRSWNRLTDNTIHPNQRLRVR